MGLTQFFNKLKMLFATKQEVSELDQKSIESIVQTTTSATDGGTNVITVTLSDGTQSSFHIQNGSKGSKGDAGATPELNFNIKSDGHLYVTY